MLTSPDVIKPGAPFPFVSSDTERRRLEDYQAMDALLSGDHYSVFSAAFMRLMRGDGQIVQIELPWARKIRLTFADLLCGEQARIRTTDEQQQDYVDDLIARIDLWPVIYEAAGDTVSYGDGVLKLGKRNGRLMLTTQPPKFWFPIVDPFDCRIVNGHVLAWRTNTGTPESPVWKGRAEVHMPGTIHTYEFRLSPGGDMIVSVDDLGEQPTGTDRLLVFHAPAWRTSSELYGHSIFSDADSLLAELEVRYAQISKVLDKHTEPGMYGPESALVQNEAGEWVLPTGRFYPLEQGDTPPGYVTWDAQMTAALEFIRLLQEQLYIATDTCPALMGKLEQGMAESGSALKRLLIAPLAAVNRLRITYDAVIKDVLTTAADLEGVALSKLHIEWRDGLPEDPVEAAQVEQTRLASGNTSTRASVIRLDGLQGEALEEELKRIAEERGTAIAQASDIVTLPPRE